MSHLILENKMMLLRDEPGWHNLATHVHGHPDHE